MIGKEFGYNINNINKKKKKRFKSNNKKYINYDKYVQDKTTLSITPITFDHETDIAIPLYYSEFKPVEIKNVRFIGEISPSLEINKDDLKIYTLSNNIKDPNIVDIYERKSNFNYVIIKVTKDDYSGLLNNNSMDLDEDNEQSFTEKIGNKLIERLQKPDSEIVNNLYLRSAGKMKNIYEPIANLLSYGQGTVYRSIDNGSHFIKSKQIANSVRSVLLNRGESIWFLITAKDDKHKISGNCSVGYQVVF